MKFAIALFAPPHAPASRRALRFAEACLAGGHEIARLFFYQDGVYSASANVVPPQDEPNISAEWSNFVRQHQLGADRQPVDLGKGHPPTSANRCSGRLGSGAT